LERARERERWGNGGDAERGNEGESAVALQSMTAQHNTAHKRAHRHITKAATYQEIEEWIPLFLYPVAITNM